MPTFSEPMSCSPSIEMRRASVTNFTFSSEGVGRVSALLEPAILPSDRRRVGVASDPFAKRRREVRFHPDQELAVEPTPPGEDEMVAELRLRPGVDGVEHGVDLRQASVL